MKKLLLPLLAILFFQSCKRPSVTICKQVWMQKNLDVANYRNGDPIPQVTDPAVWSTLTTGAWCYYNNDPANGAIYGKLYNLYAVNDPRGLAPAGWHVPSYEEWLSLETCLLSDKNPNVADELKEEGTTHWQSPNVANNGSGFTALPGGVRYAGGDFAWLGGHGNWWCSLLGNSQNLRCVTLTTNDHFYFEPHYNEKHGVSVRCVKD